MKLAFDRALELLLTTILACLTLKGSSQQTGTNKNADTNKVSVHVCQGSLTSIKNHPTKDYPQFICAYSRQGKKLVLYEVIGFGLTSTDSTSVLKVAYTTGNRFSPEMQMMLIKADNDAKLKKLFLTSVRLRGSGKDTIELKGLYPLLPQVDSKRPN